MVIEFLDDEEAEAPKETYIEFLEEERPARLFPEPSVAIEPEETGTSFAKEFQQLGPAFIESVGRPLESMGETADILGFSDIGQALKGAIQEPENYESASARFAEPKPGDASFLGFAWQYAPRAITEQAGQLVGSIATRAGGAILGAPLGPKGVLAGAFVGPAIFEAAQIIGPVAKERAKNNGRDVPNSNDIAVATVTAAGSGALNAIGARYLPGGEKATGKFFKRVAAGFIGEAPTEATQAIVQQSGETAFTEKGLEINPKSALAEGIIGGGAGSTINAIVYPFAKKTPDNAKITSKEGAEEMDIEGKANIEAINLMTTPDDLETKKNLSKIKELESYKASNEILLKSLGADDPEAQKLIDENAAIDNEISQIRTNIERSIGLVEETKETALAAQMMERSNQIDALKKEIEDDELGLQAIEEGTPERQQAEMAINDKKQNLVRLEDEFNKLSAAPKPAAPKREETQTKEQVTARIEELNKEFDALDENDTAGQDRVNRELFAEQNKLAALTAVEQGIEPQATTPTRAAARPPSGREYPYGTFYPERPILNAFVKQADKAIGAIKVAGKRAQKLKNAIRTSVTKNAGFLAGIGANVVSSEEFAKISGRKPVTADSGTYMAAYSGGKLYLVLPDVNQLTGMAIAGEKRAASRDAALDQESRAAAKKLEEEMIHLSMYKAIQEEYAKQKKPKLTEQEFMVQRITQIAREVRRTNPDVVPNVSQVYLGKIQNLDDVTLSMEFMRMVIQRVRTGQITEDLNAIRAAEREAFTDKSRTAISQFKNAILNALQMLRNSLVRYLGKGTSTREVKKMEDTINGILDEYGIVGGEANYEFKDYSAAQPTRAAAPEAAVTTTPEEGVAKEPSEATEQDVINSDEAANFLGIPKPALIGLLNEGRAPGVKVGRQWRFSRTALENWKNNNQDLLASISAEPVSSTIIAKAGTEDINTESAEEVGSIEALPDTATYEQIEKAAPQTIVSLKSSSQHVSGSFSEFVKILSNSYKSLVRFAKTIWDKIGEATKIIAIATTFTGAFATPVVLEQRAIVQGKPGRTDTKATGLISDASNLFKLYNPRLSVEEIEKSLQTPDKTIRLIQDAVSKSTPYQGALSTNQKDIGAFERSINLNSFKEGNKKGSYNYNNLIEVSDTEIKNAAQFLKENSNRTAEIEAKIREIAGALEFFSGRKLKNIKIEFRKTTAKEAATFLALARRGGSISSQSEYSGNADTITIQPQTLFGLLDNSPAALDAVNQIANELTHALQFQTNNGDLIGLLGIELSDFDTARNVLWMRQGSYGKNGEYYRDINMESNWGSELSKEFFKLKNNIGQVSARSFVEDNPKVKKSLQEKETQDFMEEVVSYGIQARAGATPQLSSTITARAPYFETFELFNRFTEPKGMQTIRVEANSPEEAARLIRQTEDYKRIKSRYPKVFSMGEPMLARREGESAFGIQARAGVTPQPRAASVQRKLTDDMVSQIEGMIEQIKPRRSRAGKEYVSRTTKKGKTYPAALVSPYSLGVNLYTSNTSEEAAKALTKIFKNNPDADFFSVASDIGNGLNRFNLSQSEIASITPMIYKLMPAYREQIMDSSASAKDRESIALNSLDVEANLAKLIVDQQQGSARTLNAAKTVRQIGSAGTAVAAYKSRVVASLADLFTIVKGNFTEVAEAVRGDRRQAIDNVFALKGVISRITELRKIAEKNPQAAADAIRKAVAKKKTRKAREIVLEFCASMFDLGGDKYANMMVDETAKAIMSIGAARKGFSPDDVYKYVYQAFSAVAKQTAREIEEKGKPAKEKVKKKREGKFLAQVKSVIGNDNDYKLFIAELKKKIGEQYSDKREFENDYKELFSMLADRQWSDAMRNQAIKDSADFLEYKFSDLITYIGENRYAAQAAVTAHIKAELKGVGATDEQVEKFISETQAYLDEETSKRVKKSLGFEVNKETGKITGGKIEKEAMKKVATAEERFKLATTLKGLTKLAASDYRAFVDKLNELIILELGFDEKTSNELSKLIESEMTKAVQAQRSINLEQAIQRAQEKLSQNNIKPKANQRTLLQRLMEMANMGQLDDLGVYEAFRQTHNFQEGYLEWSPEFAQTLREWGDRISALPEGVTRAIEEQKMGRFLLQKQGFTARDYFSSYWYFALLSQTGTQAVNFGGSALNLLGNMAVWSIYTKGKATGPMLRALYSATIRKEAPARNSFAYVMQTGLNPSGIQDDKLMKYPKLNVLEGANPENTPKFVYGLTTFGDGKIEAIPKWLNSVLTTISPRGLMRVMRATDAFMREAAYEVRAASFGAKDFEVDAYEAAKRQAEAELASSESKGKLKEREVIIRANEIYAKQRLDNQKRIDAETDALESVYSQKPVGVVGFIASLGNKLLQVSPITQLFIPFTNVVANVLNENLNYLPYVSAARLAPYVKLSPLLRGKIELKPGAEKSPFILGREEKAADIAIKGMIGTAAFALPAIVTALLGGDDEDQESRPPVQFYATGPADPEQNKIWRENGGSNYSIRFGDKYVSYLYTPLVIPIAAGSMFAEAVERYSEKQEKQPIEITDAVLTMIAAPFAIGFVAALDQSFLTGVADLIELKEARDLPKDATRIATNIISRLAVPGILRDFQKVITDEKLEGDTRLSNLIREMPGSSLFLDKKLGYFGDPVRYNSIMVENGPGRRALSLVGRIASSETPDPAFSVLYRNGLTPPKWQGSLQWSNGVRMTLAEQREFVRIAGPLMKQWVIDNADTLDELPTEEAQNYLGNNISEIRSGVKSQLQMDKEIPFE